MSLQADYNERKREVETYLDFLKRVGQLNVDSPIRVEADQQKILYANVHLLLYNLVESTVTRCGNELDKAFSPYKVSDVYNFSEKIQSHWLKHISQYKNPVLEQRLQGLKKLFEKLSCQESLLDVSFDFDSSGNLDNVSIKQILDRYEIDVEMSKELSEPVYRHCYNNMGIMQTVKHIRNALAHGEKSFTECGDIFSITEINEYARIVFSYLEFIISKIEDFISNKSYIRGGT